MGLNSTPMGERVHVGFFGRRNVGKSSLVNAVTDQELSVVSDTKGTTTDPVFKAMEILPLGPVVIIDTPGLDDEGDLGLRRVEKTREVLGKTDIAVIVVDLTEGMTSFEAEIENEIRKRSIPCIFAFNKSDVVDSIKLPDKTNSVTVSARTKDGVSALKEMIASVLPKTAHRRLVGDLISEGDVALLVVPIDSSAPKGRLILPQQQVIRDVLDNGGTVAVSKDTELEKALASLSAPPKIVITDSQVFNKVAAIVDDSIPLTSFSILMARYKGFLETAVKGALNLSTLREGDRILFSEGCTHHRQCEDIGTVKLPRWIKEFSGRDILFETSSGGTFPNDLTPYSMVIHCGGCMLNGAEMNRRMELATNQGVPFCNYGIAIAEMNGILRRSLSVFPDVSDLLG